MVQNLSGALQRTVSLRSQHRSRKSRSRSAVANGAKREEQFSAIRASAVRSDVLIIHEHDSRFSFDLDYFYRNAVAY